MAPSINLAGGHEAWYTTSQSGGTTVSVESSSPMNFRSVYVGAASLEFYWVSSGKSSHWQFTPTILDPQLANPSETAGEDGQNQIVNVELGKELLFPASGIIKTNIVGEIRAPAVHFDLPHATDLWVFLLRSPWFPFKIRQEKTSLNIVHSLAQATAQVESLSGDLNGSQSLRADVSVHGEGFKKVWLTMRRSVNRASVEETLGEIDGKVGGLEGFTWKPTITNFDVTLTANSNLSLGGFCDFLKNIGLDVSFNPFFMGVLGSIISKDFLLSDGLNIDYTLKLTGEKHIFGHENDETKITLTP